MNVIYAVCDQCGLGPPVLRQIVDGLDLDVCVQCAFDLEAAAVAIAEENYAQRIRGGLITPIDCLGGDVTTTPAGAGSRLGGLPALVFGGAA